MSTVSIRQTTEKHSAAICSTPTTTVDGTAEATGSLTPELVVALCGPIGSPLHAAADQLVSALSEFGYVVEKVRLSDLIRINAGVVGVNIDTSSRFEEIKSLIRAGDELRRQHGRDILAKLAIAKIGADRRKKFGEFVDEANEGATTDEKKIRNQRICHVINSIKNTKELDLLRLVYGDALFSIGVFSPLEIRKRNLEGTESLLEPQIEKLVDTDSGEEFSHGQSVRDTFPRSDFFVRIDNSVVGPGEPIAIGQLVSKLRRFLGLIFRTAIVTPTEDETAMYAAASAARNSACMSRQVGAAVTSRAGEVLAVGWNDVPRSGGGLYGKAPLIKVAHAEYGGTSPVDERCFAQPGRQCHNDLEKRTIASKLVDLLVKGSFLNEAARDKAIEAIVEDSRVKDLIEFSRAVHAEMHAVLGASRVAGDRVLGGKLYVTTYPCHSCARHIIAAGVAEVIYIEPYRKSLATKLHGDAISESVEQSSRVRLLQFDGVSPRRFIDLFDGGVRKAFGVLRLTGRLEALPSTHVSLRAIPRLEEVVVAEVHSKQLKLAVLVQDGGTDGQDDSAGQAA